MDILCSRHSNYPVLLHNPNSRKMVSWSLYNLVSFYTLPRLSQGLWESRRYWEHNHSELAKIVLEQCNQVLYTIFPTASRGSQGWRRRLPSVLSELKYPYVKDVKQTTNVACLLTHAQPRINFLSISRVEAPTTRSLVVSIMTVQ